MSWKHRLARLLHVERRRKTPFGVSWLADVAALGPTPATALDVGANVGQTVRELRRCFPDLSIHAFEPVPSAYAELTRLAAGDDRVWAVPAAMSDRLGTAHMSADGSSERNTLEIATPDGKTIEVPLMTVDQYLADQNLGVLDLLKIDTEGHEVAVLSGAAGALSSGRIRLVLAECDFWPRPGAPHGNFTEINALMGQHGYRVVSFYCHGVDGLGWIWGDVLFMRPTTLPPMNGSADRWPPWTFRPR